MFNPQPKQGNKKSNKLTQASKGNDCIKCRATGETRACHYNGIRQHWLGKGRGIKANDLATAEFCQKCDQEFSEGVISGFESKEDRSEQFLFWIMMTNIRRFNNGVLKL